MARRVPASLRPDAVRDALPRPRGPPKSQLSHRTRDLLLTLAFFAVTALLSFMVLLKMDLLGGAVPWENEDGSRVDFLTGKPRALRDYLDAHAENPALVAFYTPTCPHCKRMRLPFLQASAQFRALRFVAVNAAESVDMADEFQVEFVPAVVLLPKVGNRTARVFYEGAPNYKKLMAFLKTELTKAGGPDVWVA